MVYTRSQKVKEENEIKLLKQQSLMEQSQPVSVSKELPHRLQAVAVPQAYVNSPDITQPEIVKQDHGEQSLFEQNVAKHDIAKEAVVEQVTVKLKITEQTIIQQALSANVSARLNAEKSSSVAILVGNPVDKSSQLGNSVQDLIKAEAPIPNTAGGLALRHGKIVTGNLRADVVGNEDTVHATGYEASGKYKARRCNVFAELIRWQLQTVKTMACQSERLRRQTTQAPQELQLTANPPVSQSTLRTEKTFYPITSSIFYVVSGGFW